MRGEVKDGLGSFEDKFCVFSAVLNVSLVDSDLEFRTSLHCDKKLEQNGRLSSRVSYMNYCFNGVDDRNSRSFSYNPTVRVEVGVRIGCYGQRGWDLKTLPSCQFLNCST